MGIASLMACSAAEPSTAESMSAQREETTATDGMDPRFLEPIVLPATVGGFDFGAETATEERVLSTFTTLSLWGRSRVDTQYRDGPAHFEVDFSTDGKRATNVEFRAGYPGKLVFRSQVDGAFGDHAYTIRMGETIERDGQPWKPIWQGERTNIGELCHSLIATFGKSEGNVARDCEWWVQDYGQFKFATLHVRPLDVRLEADLEQDFSTSRISALHMFRSR